MVVRYAQGAAGKFLMTLLMGSKDVAHYDKTIQVYKPTDILMQYVVRSFGNLHTWLVAEPNPVHAWNIHWISAKMQRGQNQDRWQFLNQLEAEASEYFWQCVTEKKLILLHSHKPDLPRVYKELRSLVIINDPPSLKFKRKSVWYKHYGYSNGEVYLKINDPKMYPPATQKIMRQYNNDVYKKDGLYRFYRKNIWRDAETKYFMDPDNFTEPKILLSEIISKDKIYPALCRLCEEIKIAPPEQEYVRRAQQHWLDQHDFNF